MIAFVPKHLVNRRRTPSPYRSISRRLRREYTLCIQGFGNCCLAVPIRIHLEDAPDHSGLFVENTQFHTGDCESSVFAASSEIFDGYIAVSIAFAAGLHTLESAAFLTTVYLFPQAHQKLFIHHAVKRQQRARGLLPAIKSLRDCVDEYPAVLEAVIHAQYIRKVTGKPGGVVHHQAVEWQGESLRRGEQRLERIPARESGSRLRFIAADELFHHHPAFLGGIFPTPPKLIFDRRKSLQVRGKASVNGTPHGHIHGVQSNSESSCGCELSGLNWFPSATEAGPC